MKRRKALFLNLILAAFCLAALFLWPLFMGPIAIHEGTKEEIAQLLATHREAEEPFFTDLAFSGEKLPYDEESSVFYLPLDMETEGWERGELASAAPGVSLVFEEDFTASDKQEAIRTGARFRFYAVQGEEYQECWLTATGLPVVSIETEASPDMEVFGGSVYFWDSGTKAGWASASILEANIRGNTSRTYEKKGYKLNLKKQNKKGEIVEDKKPLFGLRSDDEWLLNAMYSDSSKIRDKLSADIWSQIGAVQEEFPEAYFGTRMVYVEVFFNHEYWGLYALMEPVDSKQLDRIGEGEGAKEEYSYKSVTPQDVPTEGLLTQEAYGESLAGYELKGSHSAIGRNLWEPLLSYLELRDLADDGEFAEKAAELTDQEGALDVWLYLQAVLGIDNRGKNMYYVAKNRGNSQKIYFAPWDMDITWGDALSAGTDGKVWDVGMNTALYSERINWSFGDRLIELDVDGSRSYVQGRWKELRQGVLSDESLCGAVEGLVHQIQDSGALARDRARWPDSGQGQDYELFTRMALYRMKILDYYFDGNLEEYMGLGYQ